MSLFGDFGVITQGFGHHSRSGSGSSLDELDLSNGSTPVASTERFERQMRVMQHTGFIAPPPPPPPPPHSMQHHPRHPSQGREGDDEEEWDIISKKIDSCVRLDTQFFEYPGADLYSSPPGSGNIDDDELTGTKVFLGGMRFEVVQLGRHMVSWLLEMACGVKLPFGRILIHRKSRNGKPAAPTGCASVFVAEEEDVQRLILMNQKIFCGEKGLHVAATPERMAELIQSRTILDIVDGRVRGPTHPMIIEKAYSSTSTHSPVSLATVSTPQNTSFSSSGSLTGSFAGKSSENGPPPPPPITISDGSAPPVYHRYEGDAKTIVTAESPALQQPLELFVGGLCYEATRTFVSWMFALIGIPLHPHNVTLYVDPQTGVKRGCAQVKIEETEFTKANSYTRRMLCDAFGVYIAETPQGIVAVQQTKERCEHGTRGPTHAVVIERRRNTQRVVPQGNPGLPMMHSAGNNNNNNHAPPPPHLSPSTMSIGQGSMPPPPPPPNGPPPPPPPPPMQLVQMPGGQYVMVVNAHPNQYGHVQPQPMAMPPWAVAAANGQSPSQTNNGQPFTLAPMAAPPGMTGMQFPPGGPSLTPSSFRVQAGPK